MAYWVNRDRYPFPESAECGDPDRVDPIPANTRTLSKPAALEPPASEKTIREFHRRPDQSATLRSIARQMAARGVPDVGAVQSSEVREKIIPLPRPARELISRLVTQAFLIDVNDFLFDDDARERMEAPLRARLRGGGNSVVIAHSQGTMIAYNVLRTLDPRDFEIPLFVTMGSPLGIQEVQDRLRGWARVRSGRLPVPPCVKRWVNVADEFDVVAIGGKLRGDFGNDFVEEHREEGLNPDWVRDPHSGTGYLRTKAVHEAVWSVLGGSFAQSVGSFFIARDLVGDLADSPNERHPVLIELKSLRFTKAAESDSSQASNQDTADIRKSREQLDSFLELSLGSRYEDADVDHLDRFLAARLTRTEIERLEANFRGLNIARVWRNGIKRALTWQSAQVVQANTAHLGYRALGRGIEWAILDTGIHRKHPHFQRWARELPQDVDLSALPKSEAETVIAEWDCTKKPENKGPKSGIGKDRTRDKDLMVGTGEDPDGHGTHVAGIIAGEFPVPLLSREDPTLPPVRLTGMAPQARLHIYKVLDDKGTGQDSWIIKALDHIAQVNERAGCVKIHGVNLSLGSSFDPEVYGCGHTPLCEELRRLWRQGVIVCIAAGNEGYAVLRSTGGNVEANMDLSIGDPANLEDAIAVGSVHKENPHTFGISYFSSRGPTADGRAKPDLVAPGERILSAANSSPRARPGERFYEDWYVEMSGTSMAAPHVSGLLAAFLSVRREFIGYPDRVKDLLLKNCTDLARARDIQGHGIPNLTRMLLNT